MSVLSRSALEASPLSDLHEIASEVGIDGFRRLRKEDLVDAILGRQGGDEGNGGAPPRSRSRRAVAGEASATRTRRSSRAAREEDEDEAPAPRPRSGRAAREDDEDEAPAPRRRRRASDADEGDEAPRRRRTTREDAAAERAPRERREDSRDDGPLVEGVLEVLANGSGFLRVAGSGESDDDVYVSGAQIRRCELVAGDRVAGPVRRARRSERHPSLVRVTTINGVAAEEISDGTRYSERGAAFPSEPLTFKAKDATLKQITDLAPIGRGSRVTVSGHSGSGRTATLRLLAIELAAEEGIELQVVLAGARPEEVAEWTAADLTPSAVADLGESPDAQGRVVDHAIDAAKRVVARGGHAAVVIDALDDLPEGTVRRALAAARNVPDGGTLTVIAASLMPVGGETTTIVLDFEGAVKERRPVLDPDSHTLRVETLVGARKATTIAKNHAKALEPSA
jgi:transcription termination factor Rho